MKTKRILYWTALAVTGLTAVALRLWAVLTWPNPGAGWWNVHHFGPPGFPPFVFGLPLIVLLAVGLALWYRRKGSPGADPWEALGMEYVEGRIQRDEFMARRAVLEELKWK